MGIYINKSNSINKGVSGGVYSVEVLPEKGENGVLYVVQGTNAMFIWDQMSDRFIEVSQTATGGAGIPYVDTRSSLPATAMQGEMVYVIDENKFVSFDTANGWEQLGVTFSDLDSRYYLKNMADGKYALTSHTHTELHTHENKPQLDRLGINDSGKLTVDGVEIPTGGNSGGGGGTIDAYTKSESNAKFVEKTSVYTKDETYNKTTIDNSISNAVSTSIANKVNKTDVYMKNETYSSTAIDSAITNAVGTKADKNDVYKKTETYSATAIDTAITNATKDKADKNNVYSIEEADNKFAVIGGSGSGGSIKFVNTIADLPTNTATAGEAYYVESIRKVAIFRGSVGNTNIIPLFTAGTLNAEGVTVSSSTANSTSTAEKAVDGKDNTYFVTGANVVPATPQWWKIDFGAGNEKTVAKFTLKSMNSANGLRNFVLQGSSDDTNWFSLGYYSKMEGWTGTTEQKTFEVMNPQSFRYYRILMTSSMGNAGNPSFGGITEVLFYEGLGWKIEGMPKIQTVQLPGTSGKITIDTDARDNLFQVEFCSNAAPSEVTRRLKDADNINIEFDSFGTYTIKNVGSTAASLRIKYI